MKCSAAALLAVIGTTYAAKPQLSISVQDGSFGGLDGLDPTLSWSTAASSGDVDLEVGLEASALPTSDIASLPKSYWGKATTKNGGWGISARAEVDAKDLSCAELEINADNADDDLSIQIAAIAGETFAVKSVEATKGMEAGDGSLSIKPSYSLEDESGEIAIAYDNGDKTSIELTASADSQSVTISQQLDDENKVSPTVTSDGDVSLAWEKALGDDGSLTATVTSKAVDLEWEDGAWTANINLPIDGTSIGGANVSIKRDVNF
mmetsp:Transcript_15709/g.23225  ORF Transcript_15709/g.23225 Transcript_15709/m.23225 type:complete len:264 (-) Transcript_15709:399-1190(-)